MKHAKLAVLLATLCSHSTLVSAQEASADAEAPLPVHLVMQSGRYLPPRLRALVDFLVERLSVLPVLR